MTSKEIRHSADPVVHFFVDFVSVVVHVLADSSGALLKAVQAFV